MRLTLPRTLAIVVVILLIVAGVVLLTSPGRYKATAFIPAGNPNIIVGAPILINGFKKGSVEGIEPSGTGAELTISADHDVAPFHQGAKVFVEWSAVVGERLINVIDGPVSNPEIPNGGRIEGNMPRPMEISDILRSLDPSTRARLGPLATQLQASLAGHEQDLNQTLRTAGPAFTAIGNVFRGLATDGPAINSLIKDTNELVARVASRQQDLSGIVNDLSVSTRDTAAQREQLRQVLQKLPPTLDQAQATLSKVPATTDAAVPLLQDAKSATDKLPSVSNNLAPVLQDLRPTIAELKPTLQAASQLLNYTPGLLDSAAVTVPKLGQALGGITPTLSDVRPFTPCVVGLLSTFGSNASLNDGKGQIIRVPPRIGPGVFTDQPIDPGISAPVGRDCPSPQTNPELDAAGAPLQAQGSTGTGTAATTNPVAALTGTGGLH